MKISNLLLPIFYSVCISYLGSYFFQQFYFTDTKSHHWVFSILFFVIIHLVINILFFKKRSPGDTISLISGMFIARMLVSAIAFFVYSFYSVENLKPFALQFVFHYFTFSAIEVIYLVKYTNKQDAGKPHR